MTSTQTDQRPLRPSECIHYWGIHCTYAKHKGKECPIAHFSHCLDFTPKTEKDGKI